MSSYLGRLIKKAFSEKSCHKEKESSSGSRSEDLSETHSSSDDSAQSNKKARESGNVNRQKEKDSKFMSSHIDGIRTQIKEEDHLEEKDLVVGFDFGTSCSKIIIQDVVIQTCYAVSFEGIAIDRHGYFVPSQVFINDKGVFRLESSDNLLRDLKIKLMDSPYQIFDEELAVDLTAVEVTVAFIALVLQRTITWFLNKYQDIYGNTHIIWQLNIGLPSRSYDDSSMCEVFRLVALAGWRAAVLNKEITVDCVKESIKDSRTDLQMPDEVKAPVLHPNYVEIIPEVISEVIGYARSPLRNEGLHLLVDIGASTFDVSIFTLHSPEGEDCYTIWSAEVELLGCLKLHRQRISKANKIMNNNLLKIDESLNGMTPLPKIDDYFPETTHELKEAVCELRDNIDEPFFRKCGQRIYSVILNAKNNILPLYPSWERGLPAFICGGGSYISEYRELIEDCNLELYGIGRLRVIELPRPEGLDSVGLNSDNYHRMAVAYGLSFSIDDIKEIIPPHVIAKDIIDEMNEDIQD